MLRHLAPAVLLAATTLSATPAEAGGPFDVGVIPEKPGCPAGSEYITMYMDDEDDNNISSLNGWVGATTQRVIGYVNGTMFAFCRVDGTKFFELGHRTLINWTGWSPVPWRADVSAYSYSVIKLGTTCPNGSVEWTKTVDNEDSNNNNSSTGNIAPSSQPVSMTKFVLCLFIPDKYGLTQTMTDFPDLGFAYGVFGGRDAPPREVFHHNYWLETGTIFTDDEDDHNQNSTVFASGNPTADQMHAVYAQIEQAPNTTFHVAKVRNYMTCHANIAWWNGSSVISNFDGANCFVAAVPTGTTAFIWANSYYVEAVKTANCLTGNYDGANCFQMLMPPHGFIYNNAFYVQPGVGNSCPAGSTFDGANCYFFTAPFGTSAFIWSGNFYTTPQKVCIDGNFDGANCFFGQAPANTTAFLWANNFYYAE